MLPAMREKLFVLLLFFASTGLPQRNDSAIIHIQNGFYTAQEYLDLPKELQLGYTIGVVDGMLIAPLFGAPDDGAQLTSLKHCLEHMTNTQIQAIIVKFLTDHPERWNNRMHIEAFNALQEACSKK
jgi:hypothetical protein